MALPVLLPNLSCFALTTPDQKGGANAKKFGQAFTAQHGDARNECKFKLFSNPVDSGVPSANVVVGDGSRAVDRLGSRTDSRCGTSQSTETDANVAIDRRTLASSRNFRVTASCQLRNCSQTRGQLRSIGKEVSFARPTVEELEEDLTGWNGKWKKQRALELLFERAEEEKAQEALRAKHNEERLQQKQAVEAWLKERADDERRQRDAFFERIELKKKSQQAVCVWRRLSQMLLRADEERIPRLLEPTPCERCNSSGRCGNCNGSGSLSAVYLSSKVGLGNEDRQFRNNRFHGTSSYGCTLCGGVRDGSEALGCETANRKGTGNCFECGGAGVIHPSLVQVLVEREVDRANR